MENRTIMKLSTVDKKLFKITYKEIQRLRLLYQYCFFHINVIIVNIKIVCFYVNDKYDDIRTTNSERNKYNWYEKSSYKW